MKLKEILLQTHFNDVYKEIKSRKLKKKVLQLQELYVNVRQGYVLDMDLKAHLDSDSIAGVSIYRNNQIIKEFDNITLNEICSIEIEDTDNAIKIIAKILTFYTMQGEVFKDSERAKEISQYQKIASSSRLSFG